MMNAVNAILGFHGPDSALYQSSADAETQQRAYAPIGALGAPGGVAAGQEVVTFPSQGRISLFVRS